MSLRKDRLAPVIPGPSVGTDHFLPVSSDGERISFDVVGVDLCVVNSLRRAIMSGVKTVAFDCEIGVASGVRVLENTSVMHNEMLAHRVSLLPVCLTPNELENFDPRDYQCTLNVRNTGNVNVDVLSTDFVVSDLTGASVAPERLRRIFPVCDLSGDGVLLTVLRPNVLCGGVGEVVHLTAEPRLGCGREHARWSPVSSCYFRNESDGRFRFILESVHPSTCLSPFYTVFLGLRFLLREVERMSEEVRSSRAFFVSQDDASDGAPPNPNDSVGAAADAGGRFGIVLPGHEHTLGNLVQGLLYDIWIREGEKKVVCYVGYFKRHPLVDDITLKLHLTAPGSVTTADVRDVFLEGMELVRIRLFALTREWTDFSGLVGRGLAAVDAFLASSSTVEVV